MAKREHAAGTAEPVRKFSMRLVTAGEMRRLDRRTIESGHARGEVLMERAGAGLVEAMERHYGPLLAMRALVLCGTGNNGGDGCVAARHLSRRGADVRVGLVGDPARVAGDARANLDRLAEVGVEVVRVESAEALAALRSSRDIWDYAVDALLGTGARGEPEGMVAAAVNALREMDDAGTTVVAVDLPTGVDADTGAIARRAVRADLTVTFGCPKRGHYLYPGRAFAGHLEVVDIGLLDETEDPDTPWVRVATTSAMGALLPVRDPRAHKGSAGRVLLIGGSPGLTGAVALAARAASRAGAGYVQIAVPESLHDIFAIKLTEQMPLGMPETAARTLAAGAFEPLMERIAAAGVVALGSGMSRHPETAELARRLVAACPKPMVIDADGLNAFEGCASLLAAAASPCVLTPHLGELRLLTGLSVGEIEARRLDVALQQAGTLRATLVLKGAPTVTASPGGRVLLNPTGNPGLATAGTGDVLTGTIAALMGQGLAPHEAAGLGVYLHGLAGDAAADLKGPSGMLAGDVVEALAGVTKNLRRDAIAR